MYISNCEKCDCSWEIASDVDVEWCESTGKEWDGYTTLSDPVGTDGLCARCRNEMIAEGTYSEYIENHNVLITLGKMLDTASTMTENPKVDNIQSQYQEVVDREFILLKR